VDECKPLIHAIQISRCIFQRIQNFVIYRIACTLQLVFFFFIAILCFKPRTYALDGVATRPRHTSTCERETLPRV